MKQNWHTTKLMALKQEVHTKVIYGRPIVRVQSGELLYLKDIGK